MNEEKKIKVINDEILGNGLEIVTTRIKRESFLNLREEFNSLDEIVKVVREYLAEWDREVFAVLNLTAGLQPINLNIVSVGEMNSTVANPKEILKASLLSNAHCIMLFHCHPSGEAKPSPADVSSTEMITIPASYMGLDVLDHVIVSGVSDEYFSFNQHGFFRGMETCMMPDRHPMKKNYDEYLQSAPFPKFSWGDATSKASVPTTLTRAERFKKQQEAKAKEWEDFMASDD